MSTFLFFGENSFLLQKKLQFLINDFKKREGDLNLAILEARDSDESVIISAAETPPFLGNSRLVVVREFDFKKPAERLTKFIPNLPKSTILILTAKSVDARTKLFKAFKNYGEVEEFTPLKPSEFKKWLSVEITRVDLKIEPAAIDLLVTFTLGDCATAMNELAKLKAFADDATISRENVKALTHPNLHTSVFNLTDAIGARKIENALADLHNIVDRGENLVQIFFMIVRQFRILLNLNALANRNLPPTTIARELKLHPFVVSNSLRQVRNFSETELLTAYRKLLEIDTAMKTGGLNYSSTNPNEFALALEKFIVSFA